MKPIDLRLWHNRKSDPEAIRAEIMGQKGKGWLMRWLPSRAHDNGLFLLFSNGVGQDDDEVRTGNAMILDPYGRTIVEINEPADGKLIYLLCSRCIQVLSLCSSFSYHAIGLVMADLDLELIPMSTGRRWMKARRPQLYQLIATPTGNEQDTRTVRFTYAPPASSK